MAAFSKRFRPSRRSRTGYRGTRNATFAHDTPRMGIDGKGNVDEAAPCRHIGQVPPPTTHSSGRPRTPRSLVRRPCESFAARVVFVFRLRTTPGSPISPISRATMHRATAGPPGGVYAIPCCRGLAQYLVRPTKLSVFPLRCLEPLSRFALQPRPNTSIALRPTYPLAQRLRHTAKLQRPSLLTTQFAIRIAADARGVTTWNKEDSRAGTRVSHLDPLATRASKPHGRLDHGDLRQYTPRFRWRLPQQPFSEVGKP